MEGTIATILIFAGNFAPRGWLFCAGQPLSIAEYDVLFSLIGTTYGGDGVQTFNLPDLRGRAPIGTGTFAGMFTVSLGEKAGYESVTLTTTCYRANLLCPPQMPMVPTIRPVSWPILPPTCMPHPAPAMVL
jgi:microcystin-dependent protein